MIEFCPLPNVGDLIGVTSTVGIRLHAKPSWAQDQHTLVPRMSTGVVLSKRCKRTRGPVYNWIRLVFLEYSTGHLVAGWSCWETSSTTVKLLEAA